MKKAVIFIPGIKGTKLYDSNTINNEILWEDIRFNFDRFEHLTLSFENEGKYFDERFESLVAPLQLEAIAYREFLDCIDGSAFWKFIFPYDWRLPNVENAERLHLFIDMILEKSKVLAAQGVPGISELNEVQIVTHSMGSFPLRYYIQKYGMSKIGKAVMAAPPFMGAPDAITALTVGQGFFFNHDNTRKMARTLPALFELLPRYEFYNREIGSGAQLDLFDHNNWQDNLVNLGRGPEKDRSIQKFIDNLSHVRRRLVLLDTWIDQLTAEEKKKILVLAKTEFETFTNLLVEKDPADQPKNFFNLKHSLYVDEGDGVVPNASSCFYYDQLCTYALYNRFWNDDVRHPFLMRDSRVQRMINDFLKHLGGTDSFTVDLIGRNIQKVNGLEVREKNGFKYKAVVH